MQVKKVKQKIINNSRHRNLDILKLILRFLFRSNFAFRITMSS